MIKPDKDSHEAIKFMALFTRFKDWSDDDSNGLFDLPRRKYLDDQGTRGANAAGRNMAA